MSVKREPYQLDASRIDWAQFASAAICINRHSYQLDVLFNIATA